MKKKDLDLNKDVDYLIYIERMNALAAPERPMRLTPGQYKTARRKTLDQQDH